ncbi:hypothetical protein QL285_038113 [Trifolium repens]|nr:hypothetical protein QL285_038113 [Trifolium repens]
MIWSYKERLPRSSAAPSPSPSPPTHPTVPSPCRHPNRSCTSPSWPHHLLSRVSFVLGLSTATGAAVVVVIFQLISARVCISSGVLLMFRAVVALASSSVVGVEVLYLTSWNWRRTMSYFVFQLRVLFYEWC